ncbi:hypothetical protein AQB9606_02857 [Aquabacterium sp. CECT 9606]|nr:hypothetical protein AQB9606_02857 [Aquabacterium sp. CECT 9606]
MRHVASVMLIIVGLIHLLPLSGVLSAERLATLYGLSFHEPNLAILMRHRAVLFGLLGTFFMAAAFRPPWQAMALPVGGISVVSFLWLAVSTGGYNAQITRVVWFDLLALVCLVVGGCACWRVQSGIFQATQEPSRKFFLDGETGTRCGANRCLKPRLPPQR